MYELRRTIYGLMNRAAGWYSRTPNWRNSIEKRTSPSKSILPCKHPYYFLERFIDRAGLQGICIAMLNLAKATAGQADFPLWAKLKKRQTLMFRTSMKHPRAAMRTCRKIGRTCRQSGFSYWFAYMLSALNFHVSENADACLSVLPYKSHLET